MNRNPVSKMNRMSLNLELRFLLLSTNIPATSRDLLLSSAPTLSLRARARAELLQFLARHRPLAACPASASNGGAGHCIFGHPLAACVAWFCVSRPSDPYYVLGFMSAAAPRVRQYVSCKQHRNTRRLAGDWKYFSTSSGSNSTCASSLRQVSSLPWSLLVNLVCRPCSNSILCHHLQLPPTYYHSCQIRLNPLTRMA